MSKMTGLNKKLISSATNKYHVEQDWWSCIK